MKETGLTGKGRSTTIAATPDDGKSQRKRRRRMKPHKLYCEKYNIYIKKVIFLNGAYYHRVRGIKPWVHSYYVPVQIYSNSKLTSQ